MASKVDLIAALRLINTPKVGAKTFYKLVNECGSIANALAFVEKNSQFDPWTIDRAEQELKIAKENNVFILLYTDEAYPFSLRNIEDAPPVLYAKGRLDVLQYEKGLSVVGSRAASVNGRKLAARLSRDLTESNIMIISGMARGIDAAAHKGAMYAFNQTGATIAVLGTGIDVIYPEENKDLYHQIEKQGCLLSEFPFGTMAIPRQFPLRNRIVAALGNGVLVVEAGLKSGSLITAGIALEQKKPLFAVPGTPGESRAQGSNYLIKNGAILVDEFSDILPFLKGNKEIPPQQKATAEQKILVFENNDDNYSEQESLSTTLTDFLTVDGVEIDELIRQTGKDAATLSLEILELEMSGIAKRISGNKVALIKAE